MKLITNNTQETITVQKVIESLDDNIVVYKRQGWKPNEYAILKRLCNNKVGFVSLIGGNKYSPCLVSDNWETTIKGSIEAGKVLYCFKNLEEFMKQKHLMNQF